MCHKAVNQSIVDCHVDVLDAFRLGRCIASSNRVDRKLRPILVKLWVLWDKPIVIIKCSKLKNYNQSGMFIVPNESVEMRRINTFERLKYRVERAGQHVVVSDGILVVNGVNVFSLQIGFVL